METKKCTGCNTIKLVSEFNKRQAKCKVCQKEYSKQYCLNNAKLKLLFPKHSHKKSCRNEATAQIHTLLQWINTQRFLVNLFFSLRPASANLHSLLFSQMPIQHKYRACLQCFGREMLLALGTRFYLSRHTF